MASPTSSTPVGPDTAISIKITVNGIPKKFKLPLADLVPGILPAKLRNILAIAENQAAVFERFSDSSASYVNLDPSNLHAYRTLYRAAKAKLKLRMRATVGPPPPSVYPGILNETINSLANLDFGSQSTLTSIAGPSGSQSSIRTFINPPPVVTSSAPAIVSDSASTSTSTVAQAIANAMFVSSPSVAAAAAPAESAKPTSPPALFNGPSGEQKLKIESPSSTGLAGLHILKDLNKDSRASNATRYPYYPTVKDFKSHPAFSGCGPTKTVQSPCLRMSDPQHLPPGSTYSWTVYCNECNATMLEEHYHCNICENGDYDLCSKCLGNGKHCLDDNHWLIKRNMQSGKVVNATTEKLASKAKSEASSKEMPGAYTEEKKLEEPIPAEIPTRTCNCCVKVFNEDAFVTCVNCEDYDLCIECLEDSKHGHHPGHSFSPVSRNLVMSVNASGLCKAGRNVHHAAICDNCNNAIVGVRHKCLTCPDWDFCSGCIVKASTAHPGHRFAPVYESIPPEHFHYSPSHVGVFCDGPLCKNKNAYISGVRYKCAVCPDVDFCANCEAVPRLEHNRTHPLLKFRTPVRGCSITTLVGEENLRQQAQQAEQASTTQIRTVAEVKPTDAPLKSLKEKIEIKHLLSEPIKEKVIPQVKEEIKVEKAANIGDLRAFFIRDTISDGTTFAPEMQFVQVWTVENPGPHDWPAGCSVRYVGGDNMLNVDDSHPSSDADFSKATESNVIRRPVKVGENISFRVLMKAPKREGVAISYWRLKSADGTPFGHRLWCHINVAQSAALPVEKESTPEPEVGRLGNHENFLRLFLADQMKRTEPIPVATETPTAEGSRESVSKLINSDPRLSLMREQLRLKMRTRIRQEILDRNKAHEAGLTALANAQNPTKRDPIAIKVEDAKPVELAVEPPAAAELSSSKMIFPTLEKESPVSSTHEDVIPTKAATSENVIASSGPSVPEAAPVSSPTTEVVELFDDAESVSLIDESEDNGFLTEEEYDILDASDEEAA
ncbi:hypothetical protein BT63DRAFT_408708 [Microthyrium microscopicum]|uniref:ZZ-type domain-containing protein n=1 Tax=Microthyrium microscopicum TaxID=703497 RepID=A0A6A6URY9_9PEZI|nr:hypothetical protein BT63DRAFT_408708 [Microthyrium microscopicum]